MESFIKNLILESKIRNSDIQEENSEQLEEINTTANIDGYNIPHAFGKMASSKVYTMFNMKRLNKTNKHFKPLGTTKRLAAESTYIKMMKGMLEESKYADIKNDISISPKQKLNLAVAEIHKRLFEIERIVNHNTKLKDSLSIDNQIYWKSTKIKIVKILERLNKISNKLKDLHS